MTHKPRYLFVTGRLAEAALRKQIEELASTIGFEAQVAVMPITVAALLTTEWIARRLQFDKPIDKLILPGFVRGELDCLQNISNAEVVRGPKDLRDLPEFFGKQRQRDPDYGSHDIEILAEINHAPRLGLDEIIKIAEHYRDSGADVIDLGCDPGTTWEQIGSTVAELKKRKFRVSVDSFQPWEARTAVEAGAELVLSVNGTNLDATLSWAKQFPQVEFVVIPDDPHQLETMHRTYATLSNAGIRARLDPILEPIGFGFGESLARYRTTRQQYPDATMMMGVGNLTELTDVDSAGVNVLLAAYCQEYKIQSVLTTEVISWARSAVREFDLARQLVHYSITRGVPPKRLDDRLIQLRDPKVHQLSEIELEQLAKQIKDTNYRIFVAHGQVHIMNSRCYLQGTNPRKMIQSLIEADPDLDASHAFYLGYEISKALTALTLGKNYVQDRALSWGHLSVQDHYDSNEETAPG